MAFDAGKTIDTADLHREIDRLRAMERPDHDQKHELMSLTHLWEQVEQVGHGYGAIRDGLMLVRDDHWREWAMERIGEQIGGLLDELPSYVMINWDTTVWQYRQDFYPVALNGVTYWVR